MSIHKKYFITLCSLTGIVLLMSYNIKEFIYSQAILLNVQQTIHPQNEKENYTSFREYKFDPRNGDIFAMIHIQKTGGTKFTTQMVLNLNTGYTCGCKGHLNQGKCKCLGPHGFPWVWNMWLHTLHWPCDMHADWTVSHEHLLKCVSLKYNLTRTPKPVWITIIRDPVFRYISEWQAVIRRGSNWFKEPTTCADFDPKFGFVPKCPFKHLQDIAKKNKKKFKLSFQDFIGCPANHANNRQTRMLANLTSLQCDNVNNETYSIIQQMMLQSAKVNLEKLDFFGLTEFQHHTQQLFEGTFGLNFTKGLEQKENISGKLISNLTESQIQMIKDLNMLDIELYQFAKSVFFSRYDALK